MNLTKPSTLTSTSAAYGRSFNPAAFVAASVCATVIVASVMFAFDDVSSKPNETIMANANVVKPVATRS